MLPVQGSLLVGSLVARIEQKFMLPVQGFLLDGSLVDRIS
jgi:hypothetical protein